MTELEIEVVSKLNSWENAIVVEVVWLEFYFALKNVGPRNALAANRIHYKSLFLESISVHSPF